MKSIRFIFLYLFKLILSRKRFCVILFYSFFNYSLSYANSVHLGLRIHYQTGMSHVEKRDMPVIEMLKRISEVVPQSKFLISGHTDIVGSYEMNVELSRSRADIVKLLMVRYGVDESRVQTKWFSYDAPIDSNETSEGRSKNRRTVATVYGLTSVEADALVDAANKSKRFYVIGTENVQVTDYIADVLEPQIKTAVSETKTAVSEVIEEDTLVKVEKKSEETAVAEPVAIAKEKIIKPPSENHRYYLGWTLTDNELTADNKQGLYQAIWVTDFNQSISFAYQYRIKPKWWLGLSGMYSLHEYRIVQNPLFTWDGITPDLLKVSMNLDYQYSEKWAFGADINYSEENFIVSDGGLNIFLRKAAMFGVSGRSTYRFYDSRNLSSRLSAQIELPLFGSDEINPKGRFGLLAGVDLSLKQLFKNHELNFGVYLGLRGFENDENTQEETVAGFVIKFRNKRWP